MEADVKKLNDERKELALVLKDKNNINPPMIQEHQNKIQKLRTYILSYANQVYTALIKKHETLRLNASSKLEQFCFTVVDVINEKIEKIKNTIHLDLKEFYFDDDLKLHIMVKNRHPSKYALKSLHFSDLETIQKKTIIQILKTKL